MVAPKNGFYQLSDSGDVLLQIQATPARSLKAKALNIVDTMNGVLGFAAAVISLLAVFVSLGAAILIGASIILSICTSYSLGRNICKMVDRRQHEQSFITKSCGACVRWNNLDPNVFLEVITLCSTEEFFMNTLPFIGESWKTIIQQMNENIDTGTFNFVKKLSDHFILNRREILNEKS